MYLLIAGGGKVGSNLARALLRDGHEVTLIEHEVPQHGLIHLLELRRENLEIVEIQVDPNAVCAGKTIKEVALPEGSRVISIVRNGKAESPDSSLQLAPGDSVLAILEPGKEDELRKVLVRRS